MHKRSSVLAGIAFLAMGIIVGYIVVTGRLAGLAPSPAPSPTASPAAVEYRNTQYGLSVALPASPANGGTSWQGFTTLSDSYTITNVSTGAQEGTGVVIKIRHPQWTTGAPREDLPIMVFTPANWNRVLAEAISVGAAPVPPSELARNDQYIFALPARYNFDYKLGWEEVQSIIDAKSVSAFEIGSSTSGWETYTNTQYSYSLKYPASWSPADCSAESKNNCQGFLVQGNNGFTLPIAENMFSTLEEVKAACQAGTFDGKPNCLSYTEEQITLGTTPWWKITETHHPDLAGGGTTTVIYWTSHDKNTFFIQPFSDTELQILSTFKFTK